MHFFVQVTRKVATTAPRQVAMPSAHAPTTGATATSHGVTYPLLDINEDVPKEHLVAPYGDPNKMLGVSLFFYSSLSFDRTLNVQVGGKLIPKLPKGTRVGRFVMGDHGLYDPKIRAKKQKWWSASQAGVAPYNVSSSPMFFYLLGIMGESLACLLWKTCDRRTQARTVSSRRSSTCTLSRRTRRRCTG